MQKLKKSSPMTWERLPLVEVVWEDAALDTDEEGDLDDPDSASKFGGLSICSDVGYLISKTAREVKLAVSVSRDWGTYRHSNTIPRRWVKEILYLSRPESRHQEEINAKEAD